MRRLSHTLGKTFGKAELSVDIYHPLADDISGDINSPGIFHLFLQLISNGEHYFLTYLTYILLMPITIFFYLSLYCRMHGQSHTLGNTFSKAKLSVDVHHP